MPAKLEDGFRLARWRVEPHAGRLRRGWLSKSERRVEPKAMQVLLALAERPGEFRSKNELFASVWAGRPVSDDCLSGAIHALRHALDDNPRDPHYIETRNNVGYRLIADVRPDIGRTRLMALAAILPLVALAILFVATNRSSQSASPDPLAIAVLPFMNQSGSSADDYIAAAMTDALISDLALGSRVRVISRTSVMRLDDYAGSAQDLARELGVDLLVEGAVQSFGGQVRVSAQLVDPVSDGHLWTQQYHRAEGNVLELQRDLSREIAAQIGVAIGLPTALTETLPQEDMQSYLRSRYLLAQNTAPEIEQALRGFTALMQARPQFAPAYLGQAEALLELFKSGSRNHKALRKATQAITRFELLSGASAASHRCMGQIRLFFDRDFASAERRYRLAILHNASDTVARHRYAWLLVAQQRYDEAKAQLRIIRLADPLYYVRPELATLLLYANEVDAAIAEFERLDASTGLDKYVLRTMATAYLAAGRESDARRTLIRMLHAHDVPNETQVAALEALAGDELYRHILRRKPFRSPIVSAGFHALLGDADAALDDLELAAERRDPFLFYLAALPELANLRTQPRFRAILAGIGLDAQNQFDTQRPKLSSAIYK